MCHCFERDDYPFITSCIAIDIDWDTEVGVEMFFFPSAVFPFHGRDSNGGAWIYVCILLY